LNPKDKKIYFASDFHLGLRGEDKDFSREKLIVRWLESVQEDASEIFFLGDVFDFWFEYKTVVPRGYIRLLGKLAELSDGGIKLYFFKGNHDMWMFDYLKTQLNAEIVSNELIIERNGLKVYLHHGDGLGPGDKSYKFLKFLFRSSLCQWFFARLHPNFGIGLARFLSRSSRQKNYRSDLKYLGDDKEFLTLFAKNKLAETHFDYFIFGHRHLPLQITLSPHSKYINLGEWVTHFTFAELSGKEIHLKTFTGNMWA